MPVNGATMPILIGFLRTGREGILKPFVSEANLWMPMLRRVCAQPRNTIYKTFMTEQLA